MAEIMIKFNTDNAAFAEDFNGEVIRVLLNVGERLTEHLQPHGSIHDGNGNHIGRWDYVGPVCTGLAVPAPMMQGNTHEVLHEPGVSCPVHD